MTIGIDVAGGLVTNITMLFGQKIAHHPISFDANLFQEFGSDLVDFSPDCREFLASVATSSPYLATLLSKHAAWLHKSITLTPENAIKSAQILEGTTSAALRIAKARVSLVLALCDLAHIRPLEWITENLTDFADFAVETALQSELCDAVDRGKLPKSSIANGASAGMVVLAMGKMGAHELNYSSDIDLIFLFDDSRYPIDEIFKYRAIFVQITRRVFETLNKQRHDGYVFRTDLRLRPNPAVTPVCPAMSSAESYYIREGRTWERSAFIKARVCAGDTVSGNEFLKRLEGFLWRRGLDFAAIGEIEDILTLARNHKGLSGPIKIRGHDIKLGRGGIREIEFFAQTRQLSYGGRNPELREITTIGALNALAQKGYISNDVTKQLTQNYRHHRQVEHRIQMIRDAQTHKIPQNDDEVNRLRCLMGMPDMAAFENSILQPLESTRAITKMEKLNTETIDAPSAHQLSLFDNWKKLSAFKSERAADIFERQLPKVWELAQTEPEPEQALENFDHFLSTLNSGIQLFSLFERRPDVFEQVFHVVSLSKPLAHKLAMQISVIDALADGAGAIPNSVAGFQKSLEMRLGETDDFETALIKMRSWKSEEHFKIIYSQLSLMMDVETAQIAYSNLAEVCLSNALRLSQSEINRRYGSINSGSVAILAMGKLGSQEMTSTSDVDIIVIYDGPSDAVSSIKEWDIRSYYQKLTRTLVNALSSSMSYGRLYEVDMRLRPSGRAGTVATSIDAFVDYQRTKAWVWEHLALSRARVVAGDNALKNKIDAVRTEILTVPQDKNKILQEINDMRQRLGALDQPKSSTWPVKKPLGGVLDIELFAQMSILLNNKEARKPIEQLQCAQSSGLINQTQQKMLTSAHTKFGKIEHLKRLLGLENFDSKMLNASASLLISTVMDIGSLPLLEREITVALAKNAKEIDKILKTVSQK